MMQTVCQGGSGVAEWCQASQRVGDAPSWRVKRLDGPQFGQQLRLASDADP